MDQSPLPIQMQMGGSPQQFIYSSQPKKELDNFSYISKFKTAIYGFFLFIILSQKISYKIISMIIGLFTDRAEIINQDEEPLPLGQFINCIIMALVLFIF